MKYPLLTVWVCWCVNLSSIHAATPVIPNRAPKPGEIGYRPADGASVRLNPPSFIWLHEPEAVTYAMQWAQKADFTDAVTASNFVWNTYTHSAALTPGTYFWRYQYVNKKGERSGWSQVRSVIVPADAAAFPMPTRAQQRERVPQQHPRLFLRPEELPRLRELAKGKESKAFKKIVADADKIIKAGPTPEPAHRGSSRDKEDAEAVKYWWPNREQSDKATREAETIAFVYLITQEPKYGEAARKWLLQLAAWDPDGPTNFKLNCEAGKAMLYRPMRAYDWAYDALTPADRQVIRDMWRRRIKDAWESGEIARGTGHLNAPYNSHGNRIWHKIAEGGIAMLGEAPEAEMWLDYAVNKFYSCYPIWSDDDGGWHEGVSYWAGYMGKVVTWMQFSKSALNIDGLQKPFFDQVGDFPMYVAPPGTPNSGFGDLSYRPPSASVGNFLEYFIRAKGARPEGKSAAYWRWWMETSNMSREGGIFGFLFAANLPDMPPAKAPSDLPQSKVFHGIGVASLHNTLLHSSNDVHFLFKSSPFGSQSHGHNPQNIFQLNAYGESLLTTCVYRDLHGSKFHYEWVHSTVAHNGVLVNGEGQTKHTAAPLGRITDFQSAPGWDYVAGDASAAYGKQLTRYQRRVLFVKPNLIVLYDDLAAAAPASFQFMLHALKPFDLDEKANRLSVQQPKAGVMAQYLPSAALPLTFRQWDGFKPKPTKEFPNQWHVEASTTDKRSELGMLTVLVPYPSTKADPWQAERLETPSAIGIRFTRNGQSTLVGFRKAGVTNIATLATATFNADVFVK
ncbi:MAG: DUF4962 domain-containing protein [Verrucomicrobiota bacterium]